MSRDGESCRACGAVIPPDARRCPDCETPTGGQQGTAPSRQARGGGGGSHRDPAHGSQYSRLTMEQLAPPPQQIQHGDHWVTFDCPPAAAKEMVVDALWRTNGISKVEDRGYTVVGDTGVTLLSWGSEVYVTFYADGSQVGAVVRSEKKVSINVTANPDKYQRRFLGQLDAVRRGR